MFVEVQYYSNYAVISEFYTVISKPYISPAELLANYGSF